MRDGPECAKMGKGKTLYCPEGMSLNHDRAAEGGQGGRAMQQPSMKRGPEGGWVCGQAGGRVWHQKRKKDLLNSGGGLNQSAREGI